MTMDGGTMDGGWVRNESAQQARPWPYLCMTISILKAIDKYLFTLFRSIAAIPEIQRV